MMLIIPCTCIEVFKIFLHFKADEKSFHKFIPVIRLNPLFIRKCKVLHVLFHSVSHKFMTLSIRAKSHSKPYLPKCSLSSAKNNP